MEQATDTKQYIIPVKMLCAVAVSCSEHEVNGAVQEKMKALSESMEAKEMLFDMSKKYSEILSDSSFIVVPGLFMPDNEKEEADIVIDFVKRLNATSEGELNGGPGPSNTDEAK